MGKVLSFITDGLANVLTGRGTSVDRAQHNFWHRRFAGDPGQIEAAYLGSWLHRKIVDIPAQDMTRAGRDWDGDDDAIEKIEAEEKRLGVWPKLREAVRLGRLGGGAILIGLGDNPAAELPSNIKPSGIQYLMVLSRWQLRLGDMGTDPSRPDFMQPQWFELNGTGQQVRIHPSRVICFHGLPVPALMGMTTHEDRFWGMSVVEACDEAVQQATTACAGFAGLIDEAKIDVFRFAEMANVLAQPGGDDKIMQRVQLTTTGKSVHRAVVLDKDDEWDQRQLTLAGMPDVIRTYLMLPAAASDIPATRLLGKSADGMNATGEGDDKNYGSMIAARQEMDVRPGLERLDAVLLPSAGVTKDLTWMFSPLNTLSEKEAAEVEKMEADTVTAYANSGQIPERALGKVVQNRLIESGRWPGLKEAIEEAEAAGEGLPEGDDTELGIVPTGSGKEGSNVSPTTRAPSESPEPARAANDWFNDATPRPLYVQRKLQNAAELIAWAKAQGFKTTLPAEDMHVTVLYSRNAVDPMKMGEGWSGDDKGRIKIKPGGPRAVERLGPEAVVLLFASWDIESRHRSMIEAGGSHDFETFQPHVTLSYSAEGVDLDTIKPFTGELVFGPEEFSPLDLDWKSKIGEV